MCDCGCGASCNDHCWKESDWKNPCPCGCGGPVENCWKEESKREQEQDKLIRENCRPSIEYDNSNYERGFELQMERWAGCDD